MPPGDQPPLLPPPSFNNQPPQLNQPPNKPPNQPPQPPLSYNNPPPLFNPHLDETQNTIHIADSKNKGVLDYVVPIFD